MLPAAPAATGGVPAPMPHPQALPPQMAAGGLPMGSTPPQPAGPPPMVFDGESFMAAIQLLRDDRLRGFRADIETESTIMADQQEQRQAAAEMIQAVGAFFQSSMPMMQAMPAAMPIMFKMLMFMVRRFGVGVELESAMEDAISKLEGNPGGAMQNPKAQEQQANMALKQQNLQQSAAEHQMDLQGKQIGLQADVIKAKAEMAKAVLDNQMAQQAHQRSVEMAHVQAATGGGALAPQKLPFGAGVMTHGEKR